MHRVRLWAHNSAHASTYDSWPPTDSIAVASGAIPTSIDVSNGDTVLPLNEARKPKIVLLLKRFYETVKKIILHSWVNVLLFFVPIGIASHFAGLNQNIVFAMNAIAVIPLAGLLTYATESVAHRLGDTLGALLNVSFGNAVELIILIALVKNEIRIVQASLIGSVLANLLLILGMAFILGGLNYREQIYNATVTQMSASLLCLAVLSLLIPTAFHASFSSLQNADAAVLKLSRGTSVILLLTYVLYLVFQLKSHAYMYASIPQHKIDEESAPGILRRKQSSSSSSRASTISFTSRGTNGSKTRISRKVRLKFGRKRSVKIQAGSHRTDKEAAQSHPEGEVKNQSSLQMVENPRAIEPQQDVLSFPTASSTRPEIPMPLGLFRPPAVFRAATDPSARAQPKQNLRPSQSLPADLHDAGLSSSMSRKVPTSPVAEESTKAPISRTASVILLVASTALVAVCAEFLVGSIEHLVESTPISEAFVGLIILPIVGNAAEHAAAVTVAAKNKMDLAIGVAIGSSIQIALFVTPFIVILGWVLDKNMSLFFTLFETVTLFVSTFVVNFLVLDGRSNYLEGVLLAASYIIIAVAAFFFPDGEDQTRVIFGPS